MSTCKIILICSRSMPWLGKSSIRVVLMLSYKPVFLLCICRNEWRWLWRQLLRNRWHLSFGCCAGHQFLLTGSVHHHSIFCISAAVPAAWATAQSTNLPTRIRASPARPHPLLPTFWCLPVAFNLERGRKLDWKERSREPSHIPRVSHRQRSSSTWKQRRTRTKMCGYPIY
jgi:hypothetical protein